MACKLEQLTCLCMPLQAPAGCAPSLAAAGSPAPLEAALTGPSLHTSSSTHGSVVAPNPIRAFKMSQQPVPPPGGAGGVTTLASAGL